MSVDAGAPMTSVPRYARFSRRFRAIVIDWAIAMAVTFGAVLLASVVENSSISRILGLMVVIALVLYEPILVSVYGSTLGHYFANLRVVDERSGGNVSFLKACARVVIKALLGWFSFVILAATRRNQAVHDLLTKSTVQIRDPAKASPGQYVTEQIESADGSLPPRWRRVAVIFAYLLLMLVLYVIVMLGITASGIQSNACFRNNYCSAGDRIVDTVGAVILILMMALIIGRGWKGRLFGALRARQPIR